MRVRESVGVPVLGVIIILVACISVLIYTSSIIAVAFDQSYYEQHYVENGIAGQFNSSVDLGRETAILLDYLATGEGRIGSEFFNEKEEMHLEEVRAVFRAVQVVNRVALVVSLIAALFLFFLLRRVSLQLDDRLMRDMLKRMVSWMLIGVGAVVDLIAVFFALVAFTFSESFVMFHRIFFTGDTWILDPATDNLIRMFPEQFFFDMFVKIVLWSIIFATILLVVGFLIKLGRPKFLTER